MSAPSDVITAPAPSGQSTADRVKAQLQRDYPPGALSWVDSLAWTPNPVRVPLDQIDRTTGDTEWSAAAANRAKVATMAKRISAGWRKPVILIRRPGSRLLFAMDGHSRILASAAISQPVTAWVGTAKTATGPWMQTHRRQLANDSGAVELAGAFNAAAHPRVAKGHGNGGQFGSQGTNLKAAPGTGAGFKAAAPRPQAPAPEPPEPPAEAARIAQLRSQAGQDRQLARKIFAKADALVRIRAGYIAGLLTPTGKVKGTAATKAVNAKRSAAAKKAAATRKARAKSSTKGAKAAASAAKAAPVTAAATKAANVAKLNGQITLLRHDANALIQSANHLDQLASKL